MKTNRYFTITKEHLDELAHHLKLAKNVTSYRRIQAVMLRGEGKTIVEIVSFTQTAPRTITTWTQRYLEEGLQAFMTKNRGVRRNAKTSEEKERKMNRKNLRVVALVIILLSYYCFNDNREFLVKAIDKVEFPSEQLVPKNKAFVNKESEIISYIFGEDEIYLIYNNEDSAKEWENKKGITIDSVNQLDYLLTVKELIKLVLKIVPGEHTVVEISNASYDSKDVTIVWQVLLDEANVETDPTNIHVNYGVKNFVFSIESLEDLNTNNTIVFEDTIVTLNNQFGNDPEVSFSNDPLWNNFMDHNHNLYEVIN